MSRVEFMNVSFRDGAQSPVLFDAKKYHFSLQDKQDLMRGTLELGVRYFEFFSGAVSDTEKADFEALENLAHSYPNVHLLAHVRPRDVEDALKSRFDGLNMYMGLSQRAQESNHGIPLNRAVKEIRSTVEQVRRDHPDMHIRFSGEDAFRTPIEDIFRVYDEIADFVTVFGFPDTVGVATPWDVLEKIQLLKKRYPNTDLECHFHNDRQYAMINAVTAAKHGVKFVDTSIWGLAERTGLPSLTTLLLNIYEEDKDGAKGLWEGYVLEHAYPLNVLLADILRLHVPWTEGVSLTSMTHIAGIHANGVQRDPMLYQAHELERFGVTSNRLLLGPLSGKHTFHYYLNEIIGYEASAEQSQTICSLFKDQTGRLSKSRSPVDLLLEIAEKENLTKIEIPEDERQRRIEYLNGERHDYY